MLFSKEILNDRLYSNNEICEVYMLKLIWRTETDTSIQDCAVLAEVDRIIDFYKIKHQNKGVSLNIIICQNIMFEGFRIAIMEGKIKHDEIEFHADDGLIISFNEDGDPERWPDCLLTYDKMLDRILSIKYSIKENNDVANKNI